MVSKATYVLTVFFEMPKCDLAVSFVVARVFLKTVTKVLGARGRSSEMYPSNFGLEGGCTDPDVRSN